MQLAFIVTEKTLATGITLPTEMLFAAGQLARASRWRGTPARVGLPEIVLLSPGGEAVPVTGGMSLGAQGNWDDVTDADQVFLPPLWGNPRPMLQRHRALLPALQAVAARGTPLVATGTSVCFLAAAGLLDGRIATTHWSYLERFAEDYPRVWLRSRQSITRDGELYCTASVNALTDLVLYFIREWYGEAIMGVIERQFSHEVSRSLAQPYYWLGGMQHEDEDVIRAQAWLLENLSGPFSLVALSAEVGLTPRTLSRRFVRATGESPKQYWLQLRLLRAEELLRDSNLTVQDIAGMLGFSDPSHFIQAFRRRAGITPHRYRSVVRAKQFSVR